MKNCKIPYLGEGIEKVNIAFWHVKKNDKVNKDDDLLEVTTDKASFNISSEYDGIVSEILFKKGDEVSIGDVFLKLK